MKRFHVYVLAASLAIMSCGTTFAADTPMSTSGANSAAADMGATANRAGARLEQIGNTQADAATTAEVHNALAHLVNNALTPNKFDALRDSLSTKDVDHMKMKPAAANSNDNLDRVVQQFRQDFRAKYGQDFDIQATAFDNALVYGAQDNKSVTVSIKDATAPGAMSDSAAHSTPMHPAMSGTDASSGNMSAMNHNAADNTMTNRATSDRQLNTAPDEMTQSNRNGVQSASDLSSSTLGNRTGPASSGSNSMTTVRGNDVTAIGESSAMANNANNHAVNNTEMNTGATADRTLNTAPNEMTQSNRNGVQSASDTSSSTLGNRTGPASSGSNSMTTVRGNDVTANPGVVPAPTNTVGRDDMASNTTTPRAGMPATLHFVQDGTAMHTWKLDVPDQLSADGLRDNLARHIRALNDQKSTWPSNVDAAYRTTAFHVLQAFSDTSIASER